MGVKMGFSKEDRVQLLEIVQKDTKWLGRRGLIDYSLLVGIEYIDNSSKLLEVDNSASINSPEVLGSQEKLIETYVDDSERGMGLMPDYDLLSVPGEVIQLRKETICKMDISRNRFVSSCGTFVYHISIIDYLQKWNSTKFLEYNTKVYLGG